MTTRDVLNTALGRAKKTQYEAAAAAGMTPQQLSTRLVNDTLKVRDLIMILNGIGFDIALRNRETGELVEVAEFKSGHGRPLERICNHVRYNTSTSGLIASGFYADGEHEYDEHGEAEELYVDKEGRYFLAVYNETDPSKDCITPVTDRVAKAFIEKYGRTTNM